jgi:periplasmic protein TonB
MLVLNRNSQTSRSFSAGSFIAVACVHIAIIISMGGYPSKKVSKSETLMLIESFLIEVQDPTPPSSLSSNPSISTHTSTSISTSTSTSTSTPTSTSAEAISAPIASVEQQPTTSTPRKTNVTTKSSNTNNQGNKSQDALTLPITHAEHLHNPPPPYPKLSRRRGEQGKVVIAVEIDIEGRGSQAVIHQSSGHHRLDRAALETVLKWRFIPGKKGHERQKMWVNIPINFVLE